MSELVQLLRSDGEAPSDSLTAFLQHHQPATVDVPTELQPLLLHAQLTDWMRAHEDGARHSNPLQSHALSLVHWGSESAAAPSAQHLTPTQLIRLAYGVTNLHGNSMKREFETTLVELKRQLVMDRLAHDTPLDELRAWLLRLFPLAMSMPSESASGAANSPALDDLGPVWHHAPSAEAVADEEEVASQLQSLLRLGTQRDAVLKYLNKYTLADFIKRALQWLAHARQQWIDAHPQPSLSAAALVQPVATGAVGSPQPRAKKTATVAVVPTPVPPATTVAASAAPSKAVPSWRWDSLELSTMEVEDLLPESLYASYPVPPALRASLATELASGDLGDVEQREAWLAKRAMFQAIHEQTLKDIVLFRQYQPTTMTQLQAAGAADGRRKRPKRKVTSTRRVGVAPDPTTVAAAAAPVAPVPSAAAPASSSSADQSALHSQRSRANRFIETHADLMLTQQPAALSDDEGDDLPVESGECSAHSDSESAVEPPSEDEEPPSAGALKRKPSASHRARAAAALALSAPHLLSTSNKRTETHLQPRQPSPSAAAARHSLTGKRQKL